MEKIRINLSVDADIPEVLETLAGGRNKMGDYLSKLVRSQSTEHTTAVELERMDNEALRLMVQGLGGRVKALEGELVRMQSQLAAIIAERQ